MLLGAAVSALARLALLFNIGSFKPRVQAAASEATGLDVRIAGKLALSFFLFGVSTKDVRVASKGVELGSVESLELAIDPLPLLKRKLVVRSCRLVKPGWTPRRSVRKGQALRPGRQVRGLLSRSSAAASRVTRSIAFDTPGIGLTFTIRKPERSCHGHAPAGTHSVTSPECRRR